MCGIAGVLRGHTPASALLDALAHRGPDSQGTADLGECTLAATRLAILDPTSRADQPVTHGLTTIVLNGEIYNFEELRRELMAFGWSFQTSGDTEVLLKALLQWGTGAVRRLHGMYAFLLWRGDRQELWAARDQFGIKPLYWGHLPDGGICFGSEARVLTELIGNSVSPTAVSEFLHFGSPYSTNAFQGISELPPGCLSIWHADLSVELRNLTCLPPRPTTLSQLISTAVRSHLVSHRPVALFLSGGFDSALIASQLAGSPEPPIALTIDTGRNVDDVAAARRSARRYELAHQVIRVTDDEVAARASEYLRAMDQPTVDGFNTYLVSHAANAAGFPVALSGLGGDEIFAGYGYYRRRRATALARLAYRGGGRGGRAVISRLVATRTGRTVQQAAGILGAGTTLERYQVWRCVFTADEVERLTGSKPQAPTIAYPGGDDDEGADYRALDFEWYLRTTLLRDADVFSMACGVEVRVPLLDRNLVEEVIGHRPRFDKPAVAMALGDPYLATVARAPKVPFRLPWEEWIDLLGPRSELLEAEDPWRSLVDPNEARRFLGTADGSVDRSLALLVLARWLAEVERPRRLPRRPV